MIRALIAILLVSVAICEKENSKSNEAAPAAENAKDKMNEMKKGDKSAASKTVTFDDLPKDLAEKLKQIDFKALGLSGVQPVSILTANPIQLQAPAVNAVATSKIGSQVNSAPYLNAVPFNQINQYPLSQPLAISPVSNLRNRNPLRGASRQRNFQRGSRADGPLAGLGLGAGLGGRAGRISLGGGGLSLAQAQRPSLFSRSRPSGQRSGGQRLGGQRLGGQRSAGPRGFGLGLTRTASVGGRDGGGILGRRQKKAQ